MAEKTMVGYCQPFSVEPRQVVRLFLGVEPSAVGEVHLDLVRLRCGDPFTGLDEDVVVGAGLPPLIQARQQPLRPGSFVRIATGDALQGLGRLEMSVRVRPSGPGDGRDQAIISAAGFSLELDGRGIPRLMVGDMATVSLSKQLRRNRWVELVGTYDNTSGRLSLGSRPIPGRGAVDSVIDRSTEVTVNGPIGALSARGDLYFAARPGPEGYAEAHFDGRLEAPLVAGIGDWDFARGIGSVEVIDSSGAGHNGITFQNPARAVTGSTWDGSTQRWSDNASQWAAIHFHRDDLTDAGWQADAELTVPDGLASGIYCFRVAHPVTGEVDRTPFVVRAPQHKPSSPVVFLLPTATYLAYANHRMTIDGADFFPSRNRLRPEFQYLRDHGDKVGRSMYESHPDGSGVMYSSRNRPVLNLKPGADGWAFTADTNIVAFLERAGLGYDVLTDEDLHERGAEALAPYQVVVTGSHPEYFSTEMLDAVEQHLSNGGRLMYLGGNGFYWRVAFHPDQPGVMEVRRAEDGTRGWIAEPGEYYHEWGGEYGGLWRRLGRAPNQLVGVGFAAQGFDRAAPYHRTEASFESRAAWVFDGVASEDVFGDYGIGRGAAGQEIDRFDPRLGSPPHGLVLAYSDEHSEQMLRTKEELLATRMPCPDAKIRSDVVFFETSRGGAVFSVGSIAWFGALSHNGWDNDIQRITLNVLRRFADPEPFPLDGLDEVADQ